MSDATPIDPGEPPRALLAAIARVLRPLVRLMLAHGITFPALTRLLKSIYVEVAERDFALEGRPMSDSRVSLLTGVHRKDVRVLRGAPAVREPVPEAVSLGSQIVARWVGESRWQDRDGVPRVLPRRARRGPSFDALVASVSRQDVKARVVLDELVRLGVVELVDGDAVRLRTEAFVPARGFEEKAFYLGRNVADHLAACVHNLEGGEPPMIERAVSYRALGEADVEALRALAGDLAGDALKSVNRKAMARRKAAERRGDGTRRMIFGVYFYEDRADDDESDAGGRR